MITEVLMSAGSWDIELSPAAPHSLWDDLQPFGHIVILPQYVDPAVVGDAALLSAARYVGPLLTKEITFDSFVIRGAGMTWWLGDADGKGPIIETKVDLKNSTLDNALTQLLPAAIQKGTITEPTGATYTGVHQWETALEAIRTVCASMSCEFRVTTEGKIDAGPNTSVFNITNPTVVVTRKAGSDPLLTSVVTDGMSMSEDAAPYVSRAIVVTTDSDNVKTIVGYSDRVPAPTWTDLHGNVIARTFMAEATGGPVSVATYLLSQLSDNSIVAQIDISTVFEELANGQFQVGDAFYAYDPPAFVDTTNELFFRGDVIHPRVLRLLSASWPLRRGMAVLYRTPAATPSYIDLTRYVRWEDQSTEGRVVM